MDRIRGWRRDWPVALESKNQLLTVGPEAGKLVGAVRHGDMTLDEFTSMIADDDRKRVQDALESASAQRQISAAFQELAARLENSSS